MTTIIDGKQAAAKLRQEIAQEVAALKSQYHTTPSLAVVLVGENPASQVYVRNKIKACEETGITSIEHRLPATTSEAALVALIETMNKDATINGILVQLPLPKEIDENRVLMAIAPEKDVDGFHPVNVGKMVSGQPCLLPCTPQGSMILLKSVLDKLDGLQALVIGRSNIVGKPMAHLLLKENCTVTIAHSRTRDLPGQCRQADIIVAAIGKPTFVQGNWIKKGAVVIDVGINRLTLADGSTQLVGDVDFDAACLNAAAITPVPGGVGPMTIACLLKNTLCAMKSQKGISLCQR